MTFACNHNKLLSKSHCGKKKKNAVAIFLLLMTMVLTGCTDQTGTPSNHANQAFRDPNRRVRIGFSMATVKEERWQRDHDAFQARCSELIVECVITVANGDANRQANDVENLLTRGIDVLVIAPHDATQAASMVDKAKAQNVPVISYDRLINSEKVDLYVSHQIPVIGRKIAEFALQHTPKGNYIMVYGASTDNNAHIIKKEQLAVLRPAIDRGDIKIVADQHATDWRPEEALKIVENALTQNRGDVQAVIASNDGTAGGAISALQNRGLAGKVLVTGQDAEKAALQRIAEGKQTMTVYKPIIPLANAAVEAAIALAKGQPLNNAVSFRNDAIGKEVKAVLLEVIVVDKENLKDTVIKDGYATYNEVYANVPADQRPSPLFQDDEILKSSSTYSY
jgi:D-xylose transport system substrate-binding protein